MPAVVQLGLVAIGQHPRHTDTRTSSLTPRRTSATVWRSNRILRRVFVDGDDDDRESFQVSRRMSRHAVRAAVAVAALSLAVLGSPVQAQDTPSAAQEVADLRDRAEAGDATAQYNLGLRHDDGRGVPLCTAAAKASRRTTSKPICGCTLPPPDHSAQIVSGRLVCATA